MIQDIERVTDTQIKKDLRDRLAGKDKEEIEETIKEQKMPSHAELVKGKYADAHAGLQHFSRIDGKEYDWNYLDRKGGKYVVTSKKTGEIGLSRAGSKRFKTAKVIKEDGHTDVSSAVRQCKTITEDAMQIMGKLQSMSGEDSLPTWWTNKLAVASNSMNKIRDYLLVPSMQEGLDEGKMSQIATSIDDIANAMKKDRNMKPFIDKFKKDARKTLDPKKSLEKVLPDYIPGRDVEKLKNMAEQIDERMKTPRQLINPNKEVMIVKNNKVIVIDKKDQDKYMKKGWELAEKLDKEDEPKVKEIIKMLKKASNAHAGQAKDLEKAVNERELTPRELKRREEIAKKLDLKDFEKRYGKDKGMNVKMAVATKMAKKETEEGTKFYRDVTSKDLLENKYKDAKRGAQHFSKVDETEYVWNFVYDDFGRTKLTTEPDKATHLVYTMEGLDNPKLLKISEREILDYKKGENNELSKK